MIPRADSSFVSVYRYGVMTCPAARVEGALLDVGSAAIRLSSFCRCSCDCDSERACEYGGYGLHVVESACRCGHSIRSAL
jgi:hypothetical protein